MSIASRIEQIEQHLTDDYSVLELAGADLTNVDKNILNLKQSWEERLLYFLANGTDVVWNNWLPKVTGSGENITLNNTIEAKMDFIYKGNTSQTGTPTPDNPIPVQVVSGDNTIKVEGKNLLNDYDLVNRYKIASVEGNLLTSSAISSNYDTFQPMTHSQKISLIENSDYYVSFDCRLKSGTYGGRIGRATIINTSGQALTINDTPILNPKMSSNFQRICFKSTANTSTSERIAIMLQVQENLNSAIFEIKNIMISTSNNNSYEPYTSSSYQVNLGNIELCKIGDYQDYLYKENGIWYKYGAIGKVALSSIPSWAKNANGDFYLVGFSSTYGYISGQGLSNIFNYSTTTWIKNCFGITSVGVLWISTKDETLTLPDEFITYLTNKNAIMYGVLSTPTYEEITDTTLISQLEAIKKSYNTQTNISQTNDDKPFILDVVALGN